MRLDPVARKARIVTREDVIRKSLEKKITWTQAASICRVTARHMRRLRERYELFRIEGLRVCAARTPSWTGNPQVLAVCTPQSCRGQAACVR
jgi:hypothetical protein